MTGRTTAAGQGAHDREAGLRRGFVARGAFLLLVFASGCDGPGGEPEPPLVSVRDSAGVTIVEHAHLPRSDSAIWWVDGEAEVRIGREEGPSELLFGRVAGFSPMRDGRLAVGDAMGPWIRIYDPDGTLSETIGGRGEGPGEFINFSALHPWAGDSLLVVDYEGGRWTVLDPEGAFVRSGRPRVRGWTQQFASPILLGFFGDGSALLGEFEGYESMSIATVLGGQELRVEEGRLRFFRADAEGEIGAEFGAKVASRGLAPVRIEGSSVSWSGLRAGVFRAARGDRFHYGDAERFEIRIYAIDGELERIIRVEEEPPEHPGLPADHQSDDARFRTLAEITPIPERAPAFSDLAVDELGFIWVREYRGPYGISPEPTSRWFVFDAEGAFHGSVQVPSGIGTGIGAGRSIRRPQRMMITEDRIIAVVWGPLGAETVQVFPLYRGERP